MQDMTMMPMKSTSMLIAVSLMLAALPALTACGSISSTTQSHSQPTETCLQRIKRTGVMRVGYGGFPPYTIIDTQETDPTKKIKGFAADLVYEICQRSAPPIKVEWHLINWETLRTDMASRKFDFIADPVYSTIPRALELSYCEPYSYFGVALGLVKISDQRFKVFSDLDRPDITVAIAEGWVSTDYARAHLSKPKLKLIPVGGDAFVQLDDVLLGRADIALQDSPTVVQYAKAHPDKVKVLWLDHPPCMVPGGFSLRNDDPDLLRYLNTCLEVLKTDGTIEKLDQKWKTYGYFEERHLTPTEGLRSFLEAEHKKK